MRNLIAIFVFFMVLVTSAALLLKNQPMPPTVSKDPSKTPVAIGGDFNLLDQNGKPVSDSDFRGRLMLVFFGFTSCPDICPTGMTTVTNALNQLGDKAARVAPLLITVDPERDKPEQLKEFLSHFHPAIIGLTGTPEQIQKAASAYKVYYARSPGGDAQNYMMDHSGYFYLMSADGSYIRHFSANASADEIAGAIREYIR